MKPYLRRIRKAVGALLGGVTAAAVVAVAEALDVDVSMPVAGAIAVLLSTVGTWLAPPNEAAGR